MRRFFWIPAFARMTGRMRAFAYLQRYVQSAAADRWVIPDLIQPSQPEALLRRSRLGNLGLCLLCFLTLSCALGKAEGTTNEVFNALPPAAVDEKPVDSGAQRRDPFWPVGFAPASMPGRAVESAKPDGLERGKETANQGSGLSGILRIGGVIKKGDKFYAVINGLIVQTGEVVSAVADGEVYKFTVEEIDFKKVQVKPAKR